MVKLISMYITIKCLGKNIFICDLHVLIIGYIYYLIANNSFSICFKNVHFILNFKYIPLIMYVYCSLLSNCLLLLQVRGGDPEPEGDVVVLHADSYYTRRRWRTSIRAKNFLHRPHRLEKLPSNVE